MNTDPSDPNQLPPLLDPDIENKRRTLGKEWLMVYIAVAVLILIIALSAWHLVHG